MMRRNPPCKDLGGDHSRQRKREMQSPKRGKMNRKQANVEGAEGTREKYEIKPER